MSDLPGMLQNEKQRAIELKDFELLERISDLQERSIQQLDRHNKLLEEDNTNLKAALTQCMKDRQVAFDEIQRLEGLVKKWMPGGPITLDAVAVEVLACVEREGGHEVPKGHILNTVKHHQTDVEFHLADLCDKHLLQVHVNAIHRRPTTYSLMNPGRKYLMENRPA